MTCRAGEEGFADMQSVGAEELTYEDVDGVMNEDEDVAMS